MSDSEIAARSLDVAALPWDPKFRLDLFFSQFQAGTLRSIRAIQ
jgi:hypothetical protein